MVDEETRRAVETELGRGYRGRRPRRGRGEKGEDVRKRMERWKARVLRRQRMRKKRYCRTMGWEDRGSNVWDVELEVPAVLVVGGGEAFSILAQVRYTSNRSNSIPSRMTLLSNLSLGAMREL